jgi:hypothetical protein
MIIKFTLIMSSGEMQCVSNSYNRERTSIKARGLCSVTIFCPVSRKYTSQSGSDISCLLPNGYLSPPKLLFLKNKILGLIHLLISFTCFKH